MPNIIPELGYLDLSAGVQVGTTLGYGSGFALGGEITLSLREKRLAFPSLSAGVTRLGGNATYVYGELAFWEFLSVGIGLGHRLVSVPAGAGHSGLAGHLFVGVPIPLGRSPFFVEPYFRQHLSRTVANVTEVGLAAKFIVPIMQP